MKGNGVLSWSCHKR